MVQAQRTTWTHDDLDAWLRKGQYEELSSDGPPIEKDGDDDHMSKMKIDSPPAWEHEMRQVKWKLLMQPTSSSSLGCRRGETEMTAETISSQEELGKISKILVKTTKRESCAVFVSKDVTSRASQQHRFVNRLGQFKASQLRKREVEVKESIPPLRFADTAGISFGFACTN